MFVTKHYFTLLPPANEVWDKVMRLHVSQEVCLQGIFVYGWQCAFRGSASRGWVGRPPPEPEKLPVCILLEYFLVGGCFCGMTAEMTMIKDKMFGKIITFVLLLIFEKLSSSVFQSTWPRDKYEPQHNKYSDRSSMIYYPHIQFTQWEIYFGRGEWLLANFNAFEFFLFLAQATVLAER